MKRLIILLLLVFSQVAFSQWEPCNNGLYGASIQCVAVNENLVVAGTNNGVYVSLDKGENWEAKNSGLENLNINSTHIDGSKLYIGTLGGGIYYSSDNGDSWTTKNSGLENLNIITFAVQGNDIFVGTYENGFYVSSDNGDNWGKKKITASTAGVITSIVFIGGTIYAGLSQEGLFRSLDNGETWETKNSGRLGDIGVSSIAINKGNVYLGTYQALYISMDSGDSFVSKINSGGAFNRPVYDIEFNNDDLIIIFGNELKYSTDDGESWINDNGKTTPKTVKTITSLGEDIFVGTEGSIYLSKDKGVSWTRKDKGLTNTLIGSIVSNKTNIFTTSYRNGIFLSTDNGDRWIEKNTGLASDFPMRITKIIENNNILYAGTDGDGMYLSSDYGDNWNKRWIPNNSNISNQVVSLVSNDDIIYTGTYSGVYSSFDNGETWEEKNNGLTNKKIKVLYKNFNGIYAGTESGLFFSSDQGNKWVENVDPKYTKPNIKAFAINEDNIFIGGSPNGGFRVSRDNGVSWSPILNSIKLVEASVSSLAIGDDYLFVGTNAGIFLTKDIGSTWIEINDGLTNLDIYSLLVAGKYLFAGTNNGGLFRVKLSDFGITGVEDDATENENYLYSFPPFPNPATKEVRSLVYWDMSSDIEQDEIGVYNIYGAKVSDRSKISFDKLSSYSGYLIWNCSGIETGVYMIVIKHGTESRTIKVMVN